MKKIILREVKFNACEVRLMPKSHISEILLTLMLRLFLGQANFKPQLSPGILFKVTNEEQNLVVSIFSWLNATQQIRCEQEVIRSNLCARAL